MKTLLKNITNKIISYLKDDLDDHVKPRNRTGKLKRSLRPNITNTTGTIRGEDYGLYLKDYKAYRLKTRRSKQEFLNNAINEMGEKDLDKFVSDYMDRLLKKEI